MNTRIRFRIKREKRSYRSFLRRWYNYLVRYNPNITFPDIAKYYDIKNTNDKIFHSNLKLIKEDI